MVILVLILSVKLLGIFTRHDLPKFAKWDYPDFAVGADAAHSEFHPGHSVLV